MTEHIVLGISCKPEDLEQLGTKEKFWFRFTAEDPHSWLFKFSRPNTGEHWSEKAAEQLAHALGIPHAYYSLAEFAGRFGVVSENLIDGDSRLVMGNEVLHQLSPNDYPNPREPLLQYVRVREHTVNRVLGCLDKTGVQPPPSPFDLGTLNASDVFCGYLMLDALISNQDRHHENWGIILDGRSQHRYLCPSYDHASSLGRELTDALREERLLSRDQNRTVAAFVSKAKTQFFRNRTDLTPLLTVDAFFNGVERRVAAKNHWLDKLASLNNDAVENIFIKMPVRIMSDRAKEFSIAMVLENKRRLLNDFRR